MEPRALSRQERALVLNDERVERIARVQQCTNGYFCLLTRRVSNPPRSVRPRSGSKPSDGNAFEFPPLQSIQ